MSDKTVGMMQGWVCAVCMILDTYDMMSDNIFGRMQTCVVVSVCMILAIRYDTK